MPPKIKHTDTFLAMQQLTPSPQSQMWTTAGALRFLGISQTDFFLLLVGGRFVDSEDKDKIAHNFGFKNQ